MKLQNFLRYTKMQKSGNWKAYCVIHERKKMVIAQLFSLHKKANCKEFLRWNERLLKVIIDAFGFF